MGGPAWNGAVGAIQTDADNVLGIYILCEWGSEINAFCNIS